jgi:RHS repeat-associated protein
VNRIAVLVASILFLLIAGRLTATAQDYLSAIGQPTFSSPEPTEYGYVEKANGHLHLEFPLGSALPQRGGHEPFQFRLVYDSNFWKINSGYGTTWWTTRSGNMYYPGWNLLPGYNWDAGPDITEANGCTHNWSWQDPEGTTHWFPLNVSNGTSYASCSAPLTGSALATDSSGYRLYVDNTQLNVMKTKVYAPDGRLVSDHQTGNTTYPAAYYITDANGNYESQSISLPGVFTDTLERQVMNQPGGNGTTDCTGQSGHWCYDVPNSAGSTSRYVTQDATINVSTNFGKSGVTECKPTDANPYCLVPVIRSITLPDGSSFSFKYDCDPSIAGQSDLCGSPTGQGAYYGEIVSMTLATGGTIQYTYSVFTDSYRNVSRWLSSRVAAGGTWTYTPQVISSCNSDQVGCQQKMTVSEPNGRSTVTTFTLNNGSWPVQTLTFDGPSLVSTVNTTWDFSNSCVLQDCHGANYITKASETTTIPSAAGSSLTKKTSFTYDSPQKGNITAQKDWGYYPGVSPSFPAVPDRATYSAYYAPSDSPCAGYGGSNIINKASSVTVCGNSGTDGACPGGGSRVSQTLTTYDVYGSGGLTAVSGISGHNDTNYGSCLTVRGNATKIQKWISGANYLTTLLSYDTTGQVSQTTDPRGYVTTYDYSDNFYSDNGTSSLSRFAPSKPTRAHVTTITMPSVAAGSFQRHFGYYFGSGKMAYSTDFNDQATYYHYVNPATQQIDGLDRLSQVVFPIGWNLINYVSPNQIDTFVAVGDSSPSVSCTSCRHTQLTYDAWGRKVSEQLVNSPGGTTGVDTSYDSSARVQTVSHPWGPSNPKVYETFSYDGQDRLIQVQHPDSQTQQTRYGPGVISGVQQTSPTTYGYGYPEQMTQEAGKLKQAWTDAFGRTIEIDEPSSSMNPGSGSATLSNGTDQSTVVPSTKSTGYFTIFGGPPVSGGGSVITLKVNGATIAATGYGTTSTTSSVATNLTNAINGNSNSPVTATVSGSTITITSKTTGSGTNYTMSGSPANISPPSQTMAVGVSGAYMTGGTDAHTVFDTGTVWITVNGVQASARYTQTSTGATIANDLFNSINGNPSYPVTATLSDLVLTLTAKTSGPDTNYSLAGGSSTSQPSLFSSPSFTVNVSGATLTGGAGGAGALSLVTVYKYDAADRLVQVVQGNQTRTYSYDGAGRVTSISIPEIANNATPPQQCPVTFTYDGNGNVLSKTAPAPNQTSCSQLATTYYCYDALNRVQSKAYTAQSCPMSNPATSYTYDQGGSGAFALGRMTGISDGSGSESYTFDQMGRTTQVSKVVAGALYTTSYTHNPDGQTATTRYPSGRLLTFGYDVVGHLSSVGSGATTYMSIPGSGGYDASDHVLNRSYGNGVAASYSYSSDRSQLMSLSYRSGAQTLFALNYGYKNGQANCGSGTSSGNDGLIQCIQDVTGPEEAGRSGTFSYDQLNRLTAATTSGSTTFPKWGLAWSYDRYGNRLTQDIVAGSAYSNLLTFSASSGALTNRPDGYSFDAAGNMLVDGVNPSLVYDNEGRLINANNGAATYTYDDNGYRVKKTVGGNTTTYIFSSGQVIAEYDNGAAATSPTREYIYGDQGKVAQITATDTTYYHPDHLSVRLTTNSAGTKVIEQGHFPFGELWYQLGGSTAFRFTSYEHDNETSNEYALARYYLNRFGRFMAPDPAGSTASSPSNPQSWNLYAYSLNNPINNVDPDGRECVWDDGSYDSADDPDTGDPTKCEDAGGTWFSHDIFANSPYYRGDWTAVGNDSLAELVGEVQSCAAAAGGGQSVLLLVADAFASGFSDDMTAYVLASAQWESGPGGIGARMTESSGKLGDAYFKKYNGKLGNSSPGDGALYRGRGYVQITGKANYQHWSNELSVDLVGNPSLAATPDIAAQIAVEGLDKGSFTGVSLYRYVNPSGTDFLHARRTINGMDKARNIARIARRFSGSLAGCR